MTRDGIHLACRRYAQGVLITELDGRVAVQALIERRSGDARSTLLDGGCGPLSGAHPSARLVRPRRWRFCGTVRRFERPPVSESQQSDGLHVFHAYRKGMVMVAMQLRVVFMRSTGCEPCMDLVSLICFQ